MEHKFHGFFKSKPLDKGNHEDYLTRIKNNNIGIVRNKLNLKPLVASKKDKEVEVTAYFGIENQSIRFNEKVLREVYDYIVSEYRVHVDLAIKSETDKIESELFFISDKQKKDRALEISKNHYEHACPLNKHKLDNPLKNIDDYRFELTQKIGTNEDFVISYLNGNTDSILIDFVDEHFLREILNFHKHLEILLWINKKYRLFKNNHNLKDPTLFKLFKEYEDVFREYESFEFTHEYLEENKNDKFSSHIDSIYYFLFHFEPKLVYTNQQGFLNYIEAFFGFKKTKINHLNTLQNFGIENKAHLKRVEEIKGRWEKFNS